MELNTSDFKREKTSKILAPCCWLKPAAQKQRIQVTVSASLEADVKNGGCIPRVLHRSDSPSRRWVSKANECWKPPVKNAFVNSYMAVLSNVLPDNTKLHCLWQSCCFIKANSLFPTSILCSTEVLIKSSYVTQKRNYMGNKIYFRGNCMNLTRLRLLSLPRSDSLSTVMGSKQNWTKHQKTMDAFSGFNT